MTGPQNSRGKIEDVAREANVSRSTASRVLRGLMKVTPETRERIFAAAEKVSYRPNVMARALRSGDMSTVVVLLDSRQLSGDFYGDAIASLKSNLSSRGLRLMISVIDESDLIDEAVQELSSWCSALILPGNARNAFAKVATAGIPTILLDCVTPAAQTVSNVSSIGFDEATAVSHAVEHLVSIGHRNIAFIGATTPHQTDAAREQGFRCGMEKALLPIRLEWMLQCDVDATGITAAQAFDQAIAAARGRLSAIVCATDAIAVEIIAAIRRHGKQVPDDFSVIGYGNTSASRFCTPQLTTIGHDGTALGGAASHALLAHLDGLQPPENYTLPARLILRDTTAPRCHANRFEIARGNTIVKTQTSDQPMPVDGIYELEALHSGMMLDVPNAARTPGCHVWQWKRNGTTAQLWHITQVQDEWHRMRNVGNWLYLDADGTMPDICPVVTNPLNEQTPDIQLWKFEPMEPGSRTCRITNKAKPLVVDFAYGSLVSNELVIVYPWNGQPCQQWTLQSIPMLSDEYEIVAFHSSMALDIPGQSRAAGTVPCQAERARSLSQRWRLIHRGDACYQIQSMYSNLMIQATLQPAPGIILTQNDPEAGAAQLWRIEPVNISASTYRFVSKALGLVLEIRAAQHAAGTMLQIADWSAAPHQQWLIYDDDSETGNGGPWVR